MVVPPHPDGAVIEAPSRPAVSLSLEHIVKRFGTVVALSDATLRARPGTVHALLGANGAGKSTLMNIAFGLLRPDGGTTLLDGKSTTLTSPRAAIAAGIGMVHQHFTIVPAMTVAENVALGRRGPYHADVSRERVRMIGAQTGLALDPDAQAGSLPIGLQQRLEIVKALAVGARVLILDEPTAVLAPAEVVDLLAALKRLANDGGTIILITHRLPEALAVADDVTVLRDGVTTWSGPAADSTQESLAAAMLGTAEPVDGEKARSGAAQSGPPRIVANGVTLEDDRGVQRIRGATLEVRSGEILGIAAIEGSGQHELLLALAGRLPPAAGTLTLPTRIGLVPADRQRQALVLDFTLFENVALRGAGAARGRIGWRSVENHAEDLLRSYAIRARDAWEAADSLSGGNQQRLVVARELDGDPQAFIADNPTRGLDIAATAAVHAHLRAARDAGAAVVLYSSDLDEVLALADRIVVLHAGEAREVPANRELVGRAMLGAT